MYYLWIQNPIYKCRESEREREREREVHTDNCKKYVNIIIYTHTRCIQYVNIHRETHIDDGKHYVNMIRSNLIGYIIWKYYKIVGDEKFH